MTGSPFTPQSTSGMSWLQSIWRAGEREASATTHAGQQPIGFAAGTGASSVAKHLTWRGTEVSSGMHQDGLQPLHTIVE